MRSRRPGLPRAAKPSVGVRLRADKPFIWMPPDVKTDDGRPVILMCPPDSHGWLRKYAFGLVRMRDGDEFRFVRIRGNRATPFRW